MGWKSVVAYLLACYSEEPAPRRLRYAVKIFLETLIQIRESEVRPPSWRETKTRAELFAWGEANGVPLRACERDPKVWGRHVWRLLLRLARFFSQDKKHLFWALLLMLGPLLPCDDCRKSYRALLDRPRWWRVSSSKAYTKYIEHMRANV